MKINKQYIVFIIVFILLIISIIYRVKNPFVQKEVSTLTYTGERTSAIKLVPSQAGTLMSKFLSRPEFSGEIVTDLFSLYNGFNDFKGKTEIWGPDGTITQGQGINDDDIIDDPVAKISKALLSYKFYGTYKSQGTRAIFLVKDKLVLVASVGDRIEGKYLIEELQDNYIRLKALDLNETIHIDMREVNNE